MTNPVTTETKLAGTLRELEKITQQLFDAETNLAEATKKLEDKSYSEQLAGWAIDRALETHKTAPVSPNEVLETADKFCKWIKERK